jgi:hypothetical protein
MAKTSYFKRAYCGWSIKPKGEFMKSLSKVRLKICSIPGEIEIVHVWGFISGNLFISHDGFCEVEIDAKNRCLIWKH